MGFFGNMIAEKRAGGTTITSLKNPPEWFVDWMGGGTTKSGTRVNPESSLGVSAVYSCVKIISWTLASLPLVLYNTLERGKERAKKDPLYKLFHDEPNPEQTSFQWRQLMSVHQNLYGAGISEIEFNSKGQPVALWPIPPWRVTPKRTTLKKELFYEVATESGTKVLWPYQTVVFPALTTSADNWMSPISLHRETVGFSMALSEFGAKTFGQGTNPAGILSGVKPSKEMTEQSFKEKFRNQYEGLGGSHRLMLLEEGVTFSRIGLPPEDAQYLQTRAFTIREIARIFHVPLHLIQETEKSTSWGSGIEELNIAFITLTMRPYFVQWEQEFKRRLIYDDAKFVEFLVDALLRGKMLERYQAHAIARQWGWESADDVCEIENKNPLPDGQGKSYLVPMNMIDARLAGKDPKAVPVENPNVDPSATQIPIASSTSKDTPIDGGDNAE